MNNEPWQAIFRAYSIDKHDFSVAPFEITAKQIKNATNAIIRQLYYPFRQWQEHTKKQVKTLFFEKRGNEYFLWQFEFSDVNDYNSIRLVKSQRFEIV